MLALFGKNGGFNMSEKRRDSKGRILRQGESQRKDGKYEYKYIDAFGKRHSVYSWRLVATDKMPDGKQATRPLRELEEEITRDILDDINTVLAKKKTLNDGFEEYVSEKKVKDTTIGHYRYLYKKYVEPKIGKRKIASIKYSDMRKFYYSLVNDYDFKLSSLTLINAIIQPVFKIAMHDQLIRVNPLSGLMTDLRKELGKGNRSKKALTKTDQRIFLNYVEKSATFCRWKNLITVMLGTGMRAGEISGLCWEDCDFTNGVIHVRRAIVKKRNEDGTAYYAIGTPKTDAGTREIPMFEVVKNALLDERKIQLSYGIKSSGLDGFRDFVFIWNGKYFTQERVTGLISRIIRNYNNEEKVLAESQRRVPVLLPNFTAHNLRHTFCTRMCETSNDIKMIQDIMGHTDVSVTMNIYNSLTEERKAASFEEIDERAIVV